MTMIFKTPKGRRYYSIFDGKQWASLKDAHRLLGRRACWATYGRHVICIAPSIATEDAVDWLESHGHIAVPLLREMIG